MGDKISKSKNSGATRHERAAALSSAATILVKIASYRDTELPKTIASCLRAAAHPEQLRFAVVNQVGERERNQLDPYLDDSRFSIMLVDWDKSQGLGWARRFTDGMYRDETFTLQIDSHSVFEPGWDQSLIKQWRRLGDPMAVLSSYPPAYRFGDGAGGAGKAGSRVVELAEQTPNKVSITGYDFEVVPTLKGEPTEDFDKPVPFVAGGLQFGPGETSRVLPQLGSIFTGDEPAHALRLFTHGYNVYALRHCPVYHLYIRHEHSADVEYFHENFQDDSRLRPYFDMFFQRSVSTAQQVVTGSNKALLGDIRTFDDFCQAFPGTLQGPATPLEPGAGTGSITATANRPPIKPQDHKPKAPKRLSQKSHTSKTSRSVSR